MQRHEVPIFGFRRRLLRLIAEQVDGKYTVLAQRAGIPVSSLQHILHDAKYLPGGEPLLKLAGALGVSVQFLATGHEGVYPADRPSPQPPPVRPRRVPAGREDATHVRVTLFACGCPGPCPLTEAVPPLTAASARVVVGAELVANHQTHRLIALQVTPGLQSAEWSVGAQLVVDWEARTPAWEALALIHTAGRCALGHLSRIEDMLCFATRVEGEFRVISAGEWTILGTIVAAITCL